MHLLLDCRPLLFTHTCIHPPTPAYTHPYLHTPTHLLAMLPPSLQLLSLHSFLLVHFPSTTLFCQLITHSFTYPPITLLPIHLLIHLLSYLFTLFPVHSLTHSLSNLFTPLPIHSLTYSLSSLFTLLPIYSLIHSLSYPFALFPIHVLPSTLLLILLLSYLFTLLSIHSLTHSLSSLSSFLSIHSLTYSLSYIHPLPYSLSYLFTLLPIHSVIHSSYPSLSCPPTPPLIHVFSYLCTHSLVAHPFATCSISFLLVHLPTLLAHLSFLPIVFLPLFFSCHMVQSGT